jgi:hypothetical protein
MQSQAPIEVAETSNVNQYRTFTVRRKAAKRTFPWDLVADEGNLVPSPPPAEDIPAAKKPRLEEEPFSASTDEDADTMKGTAVALPPPDAAAATATATVAAAAAAAAAADHHADSNPVTTGMSGRWTPEEDAKLNNAVANTCKKKRGKEYMRDWVAVAALVPGRTRTQCLLRWHEVFDPKIDRANRRKGKWREDEDRKLKDAVQRHGGKNWGEIAALVPGRTRGQCYTRWHSAFDPKIDRASGRSGKWTVYEDSKLRGAVSTHGCKNWEAIAALVPGRTKVQCIIRWHDVLVSKIDPATARVGHWTAFEDGNLKKAVQAHGGKNWEAIAALVPGRTKGQCYQRWHSALVSNMDPAGKQTLDEDKKLKNAVLTHGGKNWEAITALGWFLVERRASAATDDIGLQYRRHVDGRRRQEIEGCSTNAR